MRYVFCLILGLNLVLPAFAQEPEPDEPAPPDASEKIRLTLDPGDHVGAVSKVLFTPDGKQLITAGIDHTLRVWDPRTGDLLRVLRPPGFSQGFNAALSPDGQHVAVNASYAAEGQRTRHVIYLMALADGRIERVLEGHETVRDRKGVRALAFSADGKRLASAARDNTIRIWDLAGSKAPQVIPVTHRVFALAFSRDGTRLVEVHQYIAPGSKRVGTGVQFNAAIRDLNSGKVVALKAGNLQGALLGSPVAWSPDGKTFATTSRDHGLWLWNPNGTPRRQFLAQETAGVAFSKDSRQLLVGHRLGEHTAQIFNVQTGNKELDFIPNDLDPAPKGGGLCALSPAGTLAATGGNTDGSHDILVWDTANGEVLSRLLSPAWLSGPGLKAGWSADGKSVAWRSFDGAAPTARTRKGPKVKGVVKKGRKAQVKDGDGWGSWDGSPTAFDLAELRFKNRPLAGADFKGPLLRQGTFELTMFKDRPPQLVKVQPGKKGGKKATPLKIPGKLAPNPGFHHTLVGDHQVALVWATVVHLLDLKTQKQIRQFLFKEPVHSVAPSPNGRYLLVLGYDQILHILDSRLTHEVLALYVNDQDWIAWTPEGYYAASPGGERLMGWTVNRGMDRETIYHPASRFRASLYRPDVIQRVLAEGSVAGALAAADKARGQASKPLAVAQVLPPEVWVTVTPAGPAGKVTVDAEAQPQGPQPITALQLLIDDRPYTGKEGLVTFQQPKAGPVKQTWQIDLPPGPHDLRVLARTEASLGSSRGLKRVDNPVVPAKRQPNLYVLAVGINAYPGDLALHAAVGDARNLSKAFHKNSKDLFGKVEVKELLDKDATRAGILAGLDWLKSKATPADVTVFFFAGHGDLDRKEFYLVPQDVNMKDLAGTGVSRTDIKKAMQALPGKVLVLLDACHSGAMGLLFDDLSRELIDEDCGVALMCAALPSKVAMEQKQGFFTQALVGGLGGKGPQHNGSVFLHHLQSYVIDAVGDLSKDRQHPVAVVPPWMRPFPLSRPAAQMPRN
jgi:WD40 repeat protein